MEKLIPLINKIHEVTKNKNLDFSLNLPEIVVVGEQSAGKSSVLETLVGKPCLPRGTGTATLCPIRIELNKLEKPIKVKASTDNDDKSRVMEAYAELNNGSETETVTDFSQLPGMLRKKMDEMSPTRKIVDQEITVKIFSTKTPNLTLVDLPGRLLVPTAGQSVEDIDNLVEKYIENPKSIILAITIAGQDHGSSLALEAASWKDPERERTLVVVTKLDQLLRGEEVTSLLDGTLLPTKMGIIGVINRSTEAKEGKDLTIEEKQDQEEKFLKERYSQIAPKHGSRVLRSKLASILVEKIKLNLPGLKANIEKQRDALATSLGNLTSEDEDKAALVSNLLAEFCRRYSDTAQGNGGDSSKPSRKTTISNILDSKLKFDVLEVKQKLSDAVITHNIEITQRLESSTTFNERAFQEVMRPQIAKLVVPAKNCANRVKDELVAMVKEIVEGIINDFPKGRELERFPLLADEIENIMVTLLKSQHKNVVAELKRYVAVLCNFIKTNNSLFNKLAPKHYGVNMDVPVHKSKSPESTESTPKDRNQKLHAFGSARDSIAADLDVPWTDVVESSICEDESSPAIRAEMCKIQAGRRKAIRTLVAKYYLITAEQFLDYCPKVVYTCLIKEVVDEMQRLLYTKVLAGGRMDELLVEDAQFKSQREELVTRIAALDAALHEINALRFFR